MRELEARFPAGLKYAIVYDTTPFVRESVNQVVHTLIEAIILVTVVVLVFLQDWKSLLLPMIGVIVSLVGTFAVMMRDGLHAEQPDPVRSRAGDRHRRGRRDRRAGEHRATPRDGQAGPRGHDRRDEGDQRADPGDHARAQLGAAAQRVPQRAGRAVLPAVRRHDLRVDDHLGDQRDDDDAGAGRAVLPQPQAGPPRRRRQGSAAVVELRAVRRARDHVVARPDPRPVAWTPDRRWARRRGGAGWPGGKPAILRRATAPVPPRRRRRRAPGTVRAHPPRELGARPPVPRVQLALRAGDERLRHDRGLVPAPAAPSCSCSTSGWSG